MGQEIILLDEYRDIKNLFITKILHTRKGLFNHSHLIILKLIRFFHIYKCSINYVFNMRVYVFNMSVT